MHRKVVALTSVLLLGSCSSLTDFLAGKNTDYKNVASLPPLEIPPDLTSPTRDNRYAVPDTVASKSTATLSSYEAERREARPAAAPGGATPVLRPPVDRLDCGRRSIPCTSM